MSKEPNIKNSAPEEPSAADPNRAEMPENGVSVHEKPSHQEIAALAFEYCEARAGSGGDELEDWLRAERELTEGSANKSAAAHPAARAVSTSA